MSWRTRTTFRSSSTKRTARTCAFILICRRSAVGLGADAVVQSPHKTLGAITQAAWLHLSGERIPFTLLQYLVAILQSSSPNVTFTGSLDVARRQMAAARQAAARSDAGTRATRARRHPRNSRPVVLR